MNFYKHLRKFKENLNNSKNIGKHSQKYLKIFNKFSKKYFETV